MDIIRISFIAISSVILGLIIKQIKPEFSIIITLVGCAMISYFALGRITIITEAIDKIKNTIAINSTYTNIVLKIIGISYIASFMSDICKESGYLALAGQVEIFAKLSILAVSVPVILTLVEIVSEFLG